MKAGQRIAILALCATMTGIPSLGQEASQPSAPALEEQRRAEDEAIAKRHDTIRYGIDAQVLSLLKELASEKEDAFDDDLFALYMASRSARLKSAVFDFFGGREWTGAEGEALRVIEDRDLNDPALVSAALSYLASIRSKGALGFAPAIAGEDDAKLRPLLIRLLGRAGGPDEEMLLLRWLDDEGASDATRQDAVRALGDIGSQLAAGRLAGMVVDADVGKALRMYACEALGKIGDPGSVGALAAAANGDDPNVRTSAIEALAAFASPEAEAAIIEGLRDSYAQARIAACKAAGALRLAAALPFLRYKATNDPEKSVRLEACRAIAAVGGEFFSFLRERLEDSKEDRALRALCFGLLAHGDAEASMPVLTSRLKAESKEKDKAFYTALAKEVSLAEGAGEAAELARILLADGDYQIRIAGLEWARKNDPAALAAEIGALASMDPAEIVKKRAADILKGMSEKKK
jgi:hypothetical protein